MKGLQLMRFCLFITDGFGIRNFVINNFLHLLERNHEIHIIHQISPEALQHYKNYVPSNVVWHEASIVNDYSFLYFLRAILTYSNMRNFKTLGAKLMIKRPLHSYDSKYILIRYLARQISKFARFRPLFVLLETLYFALFRYNDSVKTYDRLLQEIKPDFILVSSHWKISSIPLIFAAQKQNIKTSTFIFSWDNITTKGYIMPAYDYYFVWSQLMKNDLLRYYPYIDESKVHIVGTPQFDVYRDKHLILSREVFCENLGLDPSRPILCYCGGSVASHPDEPVYLAVLADLIRNQKVKNCPQILFRPTPTESTNRFSEVLSQYPEIVFQQPAWFSGQKSYYTSPKFDDIQMLTNIVYHTDIGINIASTMTLDFSIMDVPVINPAFDVSNPLPHGVALWDLYYKFEHYKPVVELRVAQYPRSPEELAQAINIYLDNPNLDYENRKNIVELEVGMPIGKCSEAFWEKIEYILQH